MSKIFVFFVFIAIFCSQYVSAEDGGPIYVVIDPVPELNATILASINAAQDTITQSFIITANITANINMLNSLYLLDGAIIELLCLNTFYLCISIDNILIDAAVGINTKLNLLLDSIEGAITTLLDLILDVIEPLICLTEALLDKNNMMIWKCLEDVDRNTGALNGALLTVMVDLQLKIELGIMEINGVLHVLRRRIGQIAGGGK